MMYLVLFHCNCTDSWQFRCIYFVSKRTAHKLQSCNRNAVQTRNAGMYRHLLGVLAMLQTITLSKFYGDFC
uniref:Uncharacterized protein n=1 Tax=Pararge aegeria TaxID=116150 RepID=S4PBW3_9NEOP